MKARIVAGVVGGLLAGVLIASQVMGQGRPTPEQAAEEYRDSLMKVIQGNMAPLALMARGRMPFDATVVQKNSERVAFLSAMVLDAFALDTSTAANLKTAALPVIWKDKADFQRLAQDFNSKAQAMAAAAKGGQEAATKAAISAAGTTCGTCHDKYREAPPE